MIINYFTRVFVPMFSPWTVAKHLSVFRRAEPSRRDRRAQRPSLRRSQPVPRSSLTLDLHILAPSRPMGTVGCNGVHSHRVIATVVMNEIHNHDEKCLSSFLFVIAIFKHRTTRIFFLLLIFFGFSKPITAAKTYLHPSLSCTVVFFILNSYLRKIFIDFLYPPWFWFAQRPFAIGFPLCYWTPIRDQPPCRSSVS